MTYEEAIMYLDDIKTDVVYKITSNEKEAIDMAIEVLEKQIPKKPEKTVFGFEKESYDFSCPICHSRIISKIDGEWCAGAKYKFCVNCGQALDWSE